MRVSFPLYRPNRTNDTDTADRVFWRVSGCAVAWQCGGFTRETSRRASVLDKALATIARMAKGLLAAEPVPGYFRSRNWPLSVEGILLAKRDRNRLHARHRMSLNTVPDRGAIEDLQALL